MAPIPTMKVRRLSDDEEVVINASDFDATLHESVDVEEDDAVKVETTGDSDLDEALGDVAEATTSMQLDALEGAEKLGKARKEVFEAIKDRREELGKNRSTIAPPVPGATKNPPTTDGGDSILAGTVDEVSAHIATIDDPADLDTLEDAEKDGKNRAGVLKAIDKQREALDKE